MNGETYQPCCRECRTFKVKRLNGPLELKGETFGFSCEECKKAVHLGLKAVNPMTEPAAGSMKGVKK